MDNHRSTQRCTLPYADGDVGSRLMAEARALVYDEWRRSSVQTAEGESLNGGSRLVYTPFPPLTTPSTAAADASSPSVALQLEYAVAELLRWQAADAGGLLRPELRERKRKRDEVDWTRAVAKARAEAYRLETALELCHAKRSAAQLAYRREITLHLAPTSNNPSVAAFMERKFGH